MKSAVTLSPGAAHKKLAKPNFGGGVRIWHTSDEAARRTQAAENEIASRGESMLITLTEGCVLFSRYCHEETASQNDCTGVAIEQKRGIQVFGIFLRDNAASFGDRAKISVRQSSCHVRLITVAQTQQVLTEAFELHQFSGQYAILFEKFKGVVMPAWTKK